MPSNSGPPVAAPAVSGPRQRLKGGGRIAGLTALAALASPGASPLAAQTPAPDPAGVVYEDYREGVGRMVEGVLRVRLTARAVGWQPRGPDSPVIPAHAFAVDGEEVRMPGPMIRVRAGTPVEVTITNDLEKTLVIRGLTDRSSVTEVAGGGPLAPGLRRENLRLETGETGSIRFTPRTPGSFVYYGRTLPVHVGTPGAPLDAFAVIPAEFPGGDGPDGPFVGPLIVDPPGGGPAEGEQVMLITRWADVERDLTSWSSSWKMMINGRSWPATERLEYTVGDTVTWRVINASLQSHPMHLHGFYFDVLARGDQTGESTFAPAQRRTAVTEWLNGLGQSMRIRWVPETPGNWLFHCHLIRHMSATQRIADEPRIEEDADLQNHARDGMAGMVMGITVRPRPGVAEVVEDPVERRLHLYTSRRDSVLGAEPAYAFVATEDGAEPPATDSVRVPGSPLILTRGEMTEIVVHNRLAFPFGVHWHGLELLSRYDGVADWSGRPGRAIPAIEPGGVQRVRIAPPRAGTFIYHVHSEPGHQLAQGMYGPFLVLEPGETYAPERDRVFVLASRGTVPNEQMPVVNGRIEPEPLELDAGKEYRLRFINISTDDLKHVRLERDERPDRAEDGDSSASAEGAGAVGERDGLDRLEEWTIIAKDGAGLPPSQVRAGPAVLERIGVGETYDYTWTPEAAGERTLIIRTVFYDATGRGEHEVRIPVHVR